jgi:ribokinase
MTRTIEWDILVVGGANTDYLVQGPRLPAPGETVEGDVFQEASGGKGANQAVAAARLGARVALVARVGIDKRSDALLAGLAQEGVETRYVLRDQEAPTGVALVLVGGGEKQILTAAGANRRMSVADVEGAATAITTARVVLCQCEVPPEVVTRAAQLGREAGAKMILDPAPPVPLPDELFHLLDVIRPNATEAELLTGVKVKGRGSARTAAERLLGRGVGAAAVQAGDEGNLLVWTNGESWLPKLPVKSVDATGAGDAFAGALAVALAESRPLAEAGAFANAAAALATTALGAQAGLPRREAVLALLASLSAEKNP